MTVQQSRKKCMESSDGKNEKEVTNRAFWGFGGGVGFIFLMQLQSDKY